MKLLLYLSLLFFCDAIAVNHFVIIITSFNNSNYVDKNLASVFEQTYPHYRIIYIDDCSTDNTVALVNECIKKYRSTDKITLIANQTWKSQMANHYHAAHLCDDHEIIVHLDGDDWFADASILAYLNEVYTNPDIWLTYGQCLAHPSKQVGPSKPIPPAALIHNAFRENIWMYGHLRSCRAWLFKQIKLEDLLLESSFIPLSPSPDMAFMFPMLEMAGLHSHFIAKILYIWNRANPLSQPGDKQMALLQRIVRLPKYSKLSHPLASPSQQYQNKKAIAWILAPSYGASLATIESLREYATNLDDIFVIVDALDNPKAAQVMSHNPRVQCCSLPFAQQNSGTHQHILLTDTKTCLTHPTDLSACIYELERTFAFGFYMTHEWQYPRAKYAPITPWCSAWQFGNGSGLWKKPYRTTMVLYRAHDIIPFIKKNRITTATQYITEWDYLNRTSLQAHARKVGLFFYRNQE